jgi:hypothetical protein
MSMALKTMKETLPPGNRYDGRVIPVLEEVRPAVLKLLFDAGNGFVDHRTQLLAIRLLPWCGVTEEIWPTENGTLAKEFLQNAIAANGGIAPRSFHADRGTSMTSNTVTGLLTLLGIDQSHSRPHVSNDNPYSKAHFKTLNYCPAFPRLAGSGRLRSSCRCR